jgi:transcription elongation factor Elf1
MSIWIDQKYLGSLSVRLEKFSKKGDNIYNFRCPVCGDSQTNKNKARGYVFAKKGGMFYKCHNCSVSMSLGSLIKTLDPTLYKEYCLDRYKEGDTGRKPHKDHGFVFKPVRFATNKHENFKGLLVPLKELNDSHEAVVYAKNRKIPKEKFDLLFYVEDISNMKTFAPDYADKLVTNEPRLVLPFYNAENELVGFSCRALRGEKQRYIVIRIKEDSPMLYNQHLIDKKQLVYVTEGPIDSLFLPNAIAVGSSNLVVALKEYQNACLIYDNEPRNKEIVREIKKAIELNANVCIWPKNIKEKDINEMVMSGITPGEILFLINKNTFSGLKAMLEFNNWRMV